MELTRDCLLLTNTRGSIYRVSYEPFDEVTPSFEGLIEVDSDTKIEGDNIDSPMFSDTEVSTITFLKNTVWDSEGFQNITDTELGQLFMIRLEELILNELE